MAGSYILMFLPCRYSACPRHLAQPTPLHNPRSHCKLLPCSGMCPQPSPLCLRASLPLVDPTPQHLPLSAALSFFAVRRALGQRETRYNCQKYLLICGAQGVRMGNPVDLAKNMIQTCSCSMTTYRSQRVHGSGAKPDRSDP